MRTTVGIVLALTSAKHALSAQSDYVWPDEKVDFMESILYQQRDYNSFGLAPLVNPCPGPQIGRGRNTAAEWLRTAYHDMATADVHAGIGGMDASIAFELDRLDEHPGGAFLTTIKDFLPLLSPRSSVADLIALGTVFAVGSCSTGKADIPLKAGRIDATGPGPRGVPLPEQNVTVHTAIFDRQGFNVTEMIGLVACGHSLGGVHGEDFKNIINMTNADVGRRLYIPSLKYLD
jgi:hypothetical protein